MRRACVVFLAGVALVAILAPFLANDVPIVARVAGQLRFPAVEAWVDGAAPVPAESASWKSWWVELPENEADWAVMPPWPYGPFEVLPVAFGTGPSAEHPLGVDASGRDLLARLLHGAGTAVLVALASVLLAALWGVPLGALAGLFGGVVDFVVLRAVEVVQCFPAVLAVLAVAAIFGGSATTLILVLAAIQWVAFARIVRGEMLSLRDREFALAARGLGIGTIGLLRRHLMPCVRGPVRVTAAFLAANAILVESTLTFLGLGSGLRTVSWGSMLDQGRAMAYTGAWHLWVFPALAVAGTVLALHVYAEVAEDRSARRGAVDPHR